MGPPPGSALGQLTQEQYLALMAGGGIGTNTTETSSTWEISTTQELVESTTISTGITNITETSTVVGVSTASQSIINVSETSTLEAMPTSQVGAAANATETTPAGYSQTNFTSSLNNDKYSNSTSQYETSATSESTSASIQTAPSFDKAVNISIQATVQGYTKSTFQPFIFRAGLAALLQLDLARVLVISVTSVASARRAVDAVQVASVAATSDSNDASRVLSVMSSPGAAANLTLQLQALGMTAAQVSGMKAALVDQQQSVAEVNYDYNGLGRERFAVIVGLGSVGAALVLFFFVALALYRLKLTLNPFSKAEMHGATPLPEQTTGTEATEQPEQRSREAVWGDIVLLNPVPEPNLSTQNAVFNFVAPVKLSTSTFSQ
jgi:hypothetical protein